MIIRIEIEVPGDKPFDATHYLPESEDFYECWVKDGYSMRVGVQTKWFSDDDALMYGHKIV